MVERRRRFTAAIVLIALIVAGAFLISPQNTPNQPELPKEISQTQVDGQQRAIDALQILEVKGRAPRTGYSRDQFGPGWASLNGCDTRNLILQRDLKEVQLDKDQCKVQVGRLEDPYTSNTILFSRGQNTSQAVQIDHVVALSDAWQKGAQNLSEQMRQKLANDSLNLLAVDGPTNMQKSDGDAATWLPSNKIFRCRYVARQIAVKMAYKLWVTTAEQSAMHHVLQTCPNQVLPIKS